MNLVHDGTAIASNFSEFGKSASISIGTASGIGFPNAVSISKKINTSTIRVFEIK